MHQASSITRRAFLRDTAVVAALAAAPTALARAALASTTSTSGASFSRSAFTPLLGKSLRMTGGRDDFDVVLAEINDILPGTSADADRCFALLFRAPTSYALADGIRTFRHEAVGSPSMFVSPVDRGVKYHWYEAVVNRS